MITRAYRVYIRIANLRRSFRDDPFAFTSLHKPTMLFVACNEMASMVSAVASSKIYYSVIVFVSYSSSRTLAKKAKRAER